MRPLRLPPNHLHSDHLGKAVRMMGHPEVSEFIRKANREYHHWEEVRRRPTPAGLTLEETWAALKLSRHGQKALPLSDPQGRAFTYWLPDPAHEILHQSDRQGGGVLAAGGGADADVFKEMQDRVLVDSLMEEAIATSQIEGAVTTRQVGKELLRSGRKPRDRSEQMIANGYRTIRLIRERIDRPLSIELLHEIQVSITQDTLDAPADAGRFRAAEDTVRIVDSRDGEVVFIPPAAKLLPPRLERLLAFANGDGSEDGFIHPLVRASILHFWLAYEHPYVDGNGRTARALFYWSMLKSGYWLFEFLTISRIILAAPMRYHRAFLYTESDGNDLTYFLMFQLDVTRRALGDLHLRLREMQEQQQRMRALRLARELNPRQLALLDHALRHPTQVYTVESHQRSQNVSNETARTDLLNLAARGLLTEIGTRRPRQFLPAQDLRRKLNRRT